MSEDGDNIINLADRRPVAEPLTFYHETSVVKPIETAQYQTKVAPEIWDSFSPETKSDALTNDIVANDMKVFENLGMEATDEEIMEVYNALAKISNRFFGVEKEDSDGE